MLIRRAAGPDWERVVHLARECGLDYPGMENDTFWVAEESGRLAGIVGLIRHPDGLELCSLAVDPASRWRGIGRALAAALLDSVREDVHLATIIPEYFRQLGFERTAVVPAGMAKSPEWCEGCPRDRCTVMVRRSG